MRLRATLLVLLTVIGFGPAAFSQSSVSLSESTVISLYRGTSKLQDVSPWAACQARARELAIADTRTSGTVTYSCKTEIRKVVATYSVAPSPPPPPPPPPPPEPILSGPRTFFDDFEYAVGRSDPAAASLFVQHGWSHAKTHQNSPGARGYLYTVTSIPGYTGEFPGTNSTRVLAMEALPETLGGQTDFYLGLGGSGPEHSNAIPGDVWIQFWIYSQHSASQPSRYAGREKFLYVCNTDYPCHSHLWMIMSGAVTYNPANPTPFGFPSQGEFLWTLRQADGVSHIVNTTGDPDAPANIGSPTPTEWVRPNRWTLVKMHMNTTKASGNSWEVWLKPLGGNWAKVSEWIGGQTPGFTWNIPAASVGGHRVLRMPTTVDYNKTLYMDDFVIATTQSALPVYR
jgi:hypothetical protein